MTDKQPTSFEASMQELETIVSQMEQGELPLDQALKQFERGITLIRESQKTLQDAEQRVQILLNQNGQATLADFEQGTDQ
ncbi:exodeoxyribonuclease VII small subunit [Aestuariibacter sp. AA17]|uniref:Exodeoxyribonuclease 7 small subunit n=1 Tax=Fluctibacter corallii TaxID=2984329 RepID=A0ABT3A3N5_9ALTE|nr:exodeoxyribonuclease VII small subunit [Aestuariibacter sp. AA17]MCV2883213.1 exodeoxyribonuclease VII small subunit [Aestuariibacter sp. AA17]